MITRATLSTIEQGLPKYRSMLAGNTAFSPTSYESLATITVGSGGLTTATFSSIPSTYKHLQIRGISRKVNSVGGGAIFVRFNSDTNNNYTNHQIDGDGSSATAFGEANIGRTNANITTNANIQGANVFGVQVWDIVDYADTNKYKVIRMLSGFDDNGSGKIRYGSGLWQSTNAITQIDLTGNGDDFAQYTSFALYGIKGA